LIAEGAANNPPHALMCVGAGGNGKSTIITEELGRHGISPVLLNSHLTPVGLYQALWRYRSGQVVLIEDAEQACTGAVLGLLRSATEGVGGRRVLTYTTTTDIDAPPSFTFESKIILCANAIPKNPMFGALVSRCLTYRLDPSRDEILEQFRKVTGGGYSGSCGLLAPELCREVIRYVEERATRTLSMRLLRPFLRTVEYAVERGVPWQDLLEAQLHEISVPAEASPAASRRATELDCLKKAIQQHPDSVKDQLVLFQQLSGRSRATFYRLRSRLDETEDGT
jgi:hypothetical protein